MKKFIILFLVSFFIARLAFGDEKQSSTGKMSVEQIQKLDSIERAKEALNKLKQFADNITRQKRSDCLKTFGNKDFCQCLADNLPVPVSFELYVRIVTTPREELGYSGLDQENKDVVDVTLNAREKCVNR